MSVDPSVDPRTISASALERLCEALPDGVFLIDVEPGPSYRAAMANQAWLTALAMQRAQVVGRPFAEPLPEALRARALSLCEKASQGGLAARENEAFELGSSGPVLQVTLTPLFDDAGHCTQLAGIARDVGAALRAEQALRSSEERFRTLVEHLPYAITVHRDGVILYVNGACAAMLGYGAPPDLLGQDTRRMIHSDDLPFAEGRIALSSSGAVAPLAELRLLRKDGSELPVEVAAMTVRWDGADARLVIARDLTTSKQMEAQLLLADRMVSVGTLAAGIAHEINNPLGYVIGNLGFVADALSRLRGLGVERGVDVAAVEQALHEIWDGAKRVRDIVHDLRTFSRTDVERRGPVDVKRVLEVSIRMAQNELRHCARLEVDVPALPPVEGDASRLSQVFLNLLINAAQAMPERPSSQNRIDVVARLDGAQVEIDVRDNGIGMSPEVRRRVFDPFFTTKPVGVGTGLGLSICHSIIVSLKGEIAVESEEGAGTTFRIRLPLAAEGAEIEAAPPVLLPKGRSLRVLVVDDEPLVGASIRRVLLDEHEVTVLTDAAQALRQISEGTQFDVILCDLMMPAMTGMDFHAELLRDAPALARRVGFLTGGTFTKRSSSFVERMADRTLAKPFSSEELRQFVRRLSS